MLQVYFSSIEQLRERLKGLELLWNVTDPNIYLHDQEEGFTDDKGEAVSFGGGLRRVTAIGYKYLTVRLSDGSLCKILIDQTGLTMYGASFDY